MTHTPPAQCGGMRVVDKVWWTAQNAERAVLFLPYHDQIAMSAVCRKLHDAAFWRMETGTRAHPLFRCSAKDATKGLSVPSANASRQRQRTRFCTSGESWRVGCPLALLMPNSASPEKLLKLLWCFGQRMPPQAAEAATGVERHTASECFTAIRRLIGQWLARHAPCVIGGHDSDGNPLVCVADFL